MEHMRKFKTILISKLLLTFIKHIRTSNKKLLSKKSWRNQSNKARKGKLSKFKSKCPMKKSKISKIKDQILFQISLVLSKVLCKPKAGRLEEQPM